MKVLSVVALAALLGAVSAACPNACSGNGDCATNYDYCECYTGYMGNDCSQRICQFGTAYIDSPVGDLTYDNTLNQGANANNLATQPSGVPASTSLNPQFERDGYWERHPAQLWGTNGQSAAFDGYVRAQEGHFYYECSNRGLCDRETGQCMCFTGYEGAACNRTVCPNDCSGHGTCESMTEMTPSHLYYDLWDSDKTMQCKCDAGYGGVDCSKRRCMKNDDPLTITASTVDYNEGIAEANEIQVVEVRCPYGGTIKDPSISLSYTDVQFDDTYETAAFDFTASNAGTLAANALKSLPNEVLADYTQDGATLVQKVVAVSAETLETDKYYRLKVTFHHHMGNVPMMQVNTKFTCKAGVKINPKAGDIPGVENIAIQLVGDGPTSNLKVKFTEFTVAGSGNPDTVKWQAFDANNNFLGAASQTLTDANATLTGAGTLAREASKFTFEMSGGAAADLHYGGVDVRTSVAYDIDFIVDPVATVNVDLYTLTANPMPHSYLVADGRVNIERQYTHNVVNVTLGQWTGTPTYDMKVRFEVARLNTTALDAGGTAAFWYVYINDEFLFVTDELSVENRVTVSNVRLGYYSIGMVPNQFSLMSGTFHVASGDNYGLGDYFQFWLPKTPIVRSAVQQESFTWSYLADQPPAVGVKLAIQIVATSSAIDTYAWKVVGDPAYQNNGGAGYPIVDFETGLHNIADYITTQYPDDPEHQAAQYIRAVWTQGVDYDQRVCASSANNNNHKYYVWFGTEGINDSPVCSDRGICDETSGICQCFAGYAGIDCSTMNALSF